jgi:hypothetical protein
MSRRDFDNNMRGALFKNEDKQGDSQPDYKGQCEVDRVEYWVSAWINTSKSGQKYMSLSFQPKQAQQRRGAPANPPARYEQRPGTTPQSGSGRAPDDFDDDIPF